MARICYKFTGWCNIDFQDEVSLGSLIKQLESGISPLNLEEVNSKNCEFENLTEVEEYMTPEENDNQYTIEVYDDTNNIVWKNSKN
jgi:hypothetical protein